MSKVKEYLVDLRKKDLKELVKQESVLRLKISKLRSDVVLSKIKDIMSFQKVQKELARLLTVINEKIAFEKSHSKEAE